MPTIQGPTQGPTGTTQCDCEKTCDDTAPGTPVLLQVAAFQPASKDARVAHVGAINPRYAYKDDAVIQLGNIEIGSTIEVINKSKNPKARFGKDAIALTITGFDPQQRRAAVYLSRAEMDAKGLRAGDILDLRVRDEAGNVSKSIRFELEPSEWANADVNDKVDGSWRWERGAEFTGILDGVSKYKALIAKVVTDTDAPLLPVDDMTFAVVENGGKKTVMLKGLEACEPFSTVTVFNTRTAQRKSTDVGSLEDLADDETIMLDLGEDCRNGDPLLIRVTDNNRVQSAETQIVYSSCSPGGKAKVQSPLDLQIKPALP